MVLLFATIANNHFIKRTIANEYEKVDADMKPPQTKIPPISESVAPLFQSLLERVWVTKYFGTASEIFNFSSDMSLCDTLPGSHADQDSKNGIFLWQHKCLPIEVRWTKNDSDLGGTVVVRMLDFDKSAEVLGEVFNIITADSLGAYEIKKDKKDFITNLIKKELEAKDFEPMFGYEGFLKTYPTLEGRFFLDEASIESLDANEPEDFRKYFSNRGKKGAFSIHYNPENYKKEADIIEYTLALPAGFFGVGDEYKKGKMP